MTNKLNGLKKHKIVKRVPTGRRKSKKCAGFTRCNYNASMKKDIGFLQIKIIFMLRYTGYLKPPILIPNIVSFKCLGCSKNIPS